MILLDTGVQPGLLHKILRCDYWLFSRINQNWTCPFLDTALLFMREAALWVPLYLFLLVFTTLNFRKKGWIWSAYVVMTVIISDLVSSQLIRDHLVFRLRPCDNVLWADSMRFLANYCPADSSFTSSNACNHFAIAVFIFGTFRHLSPWWSLILVWAFLISYAQVYVGVHYPLDVFCGGLLGALIGWLTSRVFRLQIGTLHLPNNLSAHA